MKREYIQSIYFVFKDHLELYKRYLEKIEEELNLSRT